MYVQQIVRRVLDMSTWVINFYSYIGISLFFLNQNISATNSDEDLLCPIATSVGVGHTPSDFDQSHSSSSASIMGATTENEDDILTSLKTSPFTLSIFKDALKKSCISGYSDVTDFLLDEKNRNRVSDKKKYFSGNYAQNLCEIYLICLSLAAEYNKPSIFEKIIKCILTKPEDMKIFNSSCSIENNEIFENYNLRHQIHFSIVLTNEFDKDYLCGAKNPFSIAVRFNKSDFLCIFKKYRKEIMGMGLVTKKLHVAISDYFFNTAFDAKNIDELDELQRDCYFPTSTLINKYLADAVNSSDSECLKLVFEKFPVKNHEGLDDKLIDQCIEFIKKTNPLYNHLISKSREETEKEHRQLLEAKETIQDMKGTMKNRNVERAGAVCLGVAVSYGVLALHCTIS
jgi:hypothetical protein